MDELAFHADEIAAQSEAGMLTGDSGIRPFMPEQHRAFFEQLGYAFVSVPDETGWPLATVLSGPPGFVRAPTPEVLRIDALPARSDPALAGFVAGNEIGLLGLDLSTRRRNRANGRVAGIDGAGLWIQVAQSFGNCAQYIQTRVIEAARPPSDDAAIVVQGLDDGARRLIAGSDTFFVASRSRADVGRAGGFDISHRGGAPGFVRIEGDTLVIPDFRGNRYFNTLGNFLGDARCGLLFIDFATGDVLQVAGTVAIDWHPDPEGLPPGAQRLWRVSVARSWWRRGALPFVWAFGHYAPTSLRAGVWPENLPDAEKSLSLPAR